MITWLDEQFSAVPEFLLQLPEDEELDTFQMGIVEGTDAAFLIFLDALESDDDDSWEFVEQLMGDRRVLMQNIRERNLSATPEEDHVRQRIIVETTNAVENIFFLLAQLTRDFRNESDQSPMSAAG